VGFRKQDLFKQRCYKMLRRFLTLTGENKTYRTSEMLGYDHIQLQEHIMNHPNYEIVKNKRWHIDHIFPLKAFLDHNIFDVKLVNCLENLQPITMSENSKKSSNYDPIKFKKWLSEKGMKLYEI
jgi:hypothetical protein